MFAQPALLRSGDTVSEQRPPEAASGPDGQRDWLRLASSSDPHGVAGLIYRFLLMIASRDLGWSVVVRLMTMMIGVAVAVRLAVDPGQLHHMSAWFAASPRRWMPGGGLFVGTVCTICGLIARRKHRLGRTDSRPTIVEPKTITPDINTEGVYTNGIPNGSDRPPATAKSLHD